MVDDECSHEAQSFQGVWFNTMSFSTTSFSDMCPTIQGLSFHAVTNKNDQLARVSPSAPTR